MYIWYIVYCLTTLYHFTLLTYSDADGFEIKNFKLMMAIKLLIICYLFKCLLLHYSYSSKIFINVKSLTFFFSLICTFKRSIKFERYYTCSIKAWNATDFIQKNV